MADLISRAALLKECEECQKTDPRFEERGWANHFINEAGEPSTEWYCVEGMIENAPAVDAVPVVRCRDCKYGKLCLDADGHRLIQCTNTKYPTANVETWPLELDWYCAGGERRDDDALSGR